ncbi:hypothetical protein [Phytomonospora endophytica]|uniref:Uncharacterized protein n=1 Tax=Phytomonospora endophytica TaxID=714109 RepID=A0A841FKJ2_9ACTN|nr:hypothetical protein [Phytomonospora endophytica]MBB6037851.1 hypothetical protein [Phytomonospora endophytica]GIG68750.1 hypothetical protein Pen01_50450 [Phytomonospora endophytica]
MGDNIEPPARVPPLEGVLLDQSDSEVRFQTDAGTWLFRRDDVVAIVDREGGDRSDGPRSVCLEVRAGAEAEFSQKVRIEVTERPMTTSEDLPISAGHEELGELTRAWAVRLYGSADMDLMLAEAMSWTSNATMTGTCGGGGWVDDYQTSDSLD